MSVQNEKLIHGKPSTIRKPRWHRRKDDRPKEIMDAALGLFLKKGYSATRLEDIARIANVTKGTLFIYFANKEDLYNSLVNEGIAQLSSFGEVNYIDFRSSASESILLLVHSWWKFLASTSYGKLPKLVIAEAENFPEISRRFINVVIMPVHKLFANVVDQGIKSGDFQSFNPEIVARIILSSLNEQLIW